MEITFSRPIFLFLLASIPLMIITHFFTMNYLRRRAVRFANFEAIRRVTGSDKSDIRNTFKLSHNVVLLVLRIITLIVLIMAASGTIFWFFGQSSEVNYVLAIDASSSMLADDFEPNRLEVAKEAALFFVNSLSSRANIGVLSFAGSPFIEQDITDAKNDARKAVRELHIKSIGGTDIAGAIIMGTNMLKLEEEDKGRTIILLTDGRRTSGPLIEDGIAFAKENRVIVHTIGVATEEGGSFIRIEAVSSIDTETLKQIADETGGRFFLASDEDLLAAAFREISQSSDQSIPLSLSNGLMMLAIMLLFLEWGLLSAKFRSIP